MDCGMAAEGCGGTCPACGLAAQPQHITPAAETVDSLPAASTPPLLVTRSICCACHWLLVRQQWRSRGAIDVRRCASVVGFCPWGGSGSPRQEAGLLAPGSSRTAGPTAVPRLHGSACKWVIQQLGGMEARVAGRGGASRLGARWMGAGPPLGRNVSQAAALAGVQRQLLNKIILTMAQLHGHN